MVVSVFENLGLKAEMIRGRVVPVYRLNHLDPRLIELPPRLLEQSGRGLMGPAIGPSSYQERRNAEIDYTDEELLFRRQNIAGGRVSHASIL